MATKAEQIQNLVRAFGGEPRESTIEDAIEDLVMSMPVEWHHVGWSGYVCKPNGSSMPDWDVLKNIMSTKTPTDTAILSLATAANSLVHPTKNIQKPTVLNNFLTAAADLRNAGVEFNYKFDVAYTVDINDYNEHKLINIMYNESSDKWVITDQTDEMTDIYRVIIQNGAISSYYNYITLTSPNGTSYQISVSDDGTLVVE